MPAVNFKSPSHWEDWCSWGLGIWLCISPWALRFELEPSATRVAVISGFLIILIGIVALRRTSVRRRRVEADGQRR
jgi:SPW repeat